MKNKYTYYLLGFLLLVGAIIGYHYLAAYQAEQQVGKEIAKQAGDRKDISVQYSSLDIAPFTATVTFRDLTFVFGDHIERAKNISLDIGYLDFLNIYFGGLKYGLNHLYRANITSIAPSYINKRGLNEIKLDTLKISYSGNALDGIQSAVSGTPFKSSQKIEAKGKGITFSAPATLLSTLSGKSVTYRGEVASQQRSFWEGGTHKLTIDSLIWTPSVSFQNSYRFFIKGFGYPTDAIPFKFARMQLEPASKANALNIDTALRSELFLLSGSGFVQLREPPRNSRLHDFELTLSDFSTVFGNVIQNIEKLFSINLPRKKGQIRLQLEGPLSQPSIVRQ